MKRNVLFSGILIVLCTGGCKEKYIPKTNYPFTGYLVVEGFIDAAGGVTTFKLSRSTTLDSSNYRRESGAAVAVESENNDSYPLYENSPGVYTADRLPIQSGVRYRLRISTGAKQYLSQYSSVYITPAIDSVSWNEKNAGIQTYVSTHGQTSDSRYYKWRFDETWEYSAKYYSTLVWDPAYTYNVNGFRTRNLDELFYTCWKSDTSSELLIGSTAKLDANVLNDQPVTFIPYSEDYNKLYQRYSINVYMESISGDEYDWYDKLRKNTESLGSIFDAQPSELTGNIRGVTDSTETVIGWVGSHSVTQRRIFIGRGDLPSNPNLPRGYEYCMLDTLVFGSQDKQIAATYSIANYELPVIFWRISGFPSPIGIIGSSADCVDCRAKGGVTTEPIFWKE